MNNKFLNKKILISIIVGIVAIVGIIFVINMKKDNTKGNEKKYDFNNKNNYISVSNNEGKFGYIDTEGNIKIDFTYDLAESFKNGIGLVREGTKFALINTKGEVIVEASSIRRVNEEIISKYSNMYIAYIQNEDEKGYILLDSSGKRCGNKTYKELYAEKGVIYHISEGKYSILDLSGNDIYTSDSKIEIYQTINNLTLIYKDKNATIINNISGEVIVDNIKVDYRDDIEKDGEYYIFKNAVIRDSKLVYLADSDVFDINLEGIAWLSSGKYYSVNKQKEISITNNKERFNSSMYRLLDKYVVYQNENNKVCLVDSSGNEVKSFDVGNKILIETFGNNIILEEKNTKSLFNIDNGTYIFENVKDVRINGIIDIYPETYYSINVTTDEMVKYNEHSWIQEVKSYLVDADFNKILDEKYHIVDSLAFVEDNLKCAYDLTGKKYFIVSTSKFAYDEYGIIDSEGNEISSFDYYDFKQGNEDLPIIVMFKKDGTRDIYNLESGKLILSINRTEYIGSNYISVYQGDDKGTNYYNFDGKLIYSTK